MKRKSERGGAGLWILAIFVAAGVFVGFRMVKLKLDAKTIESEVAAMGESALQSLNPDIKGQVTRTLALYDVVINPDDVKVDIVGNREKIRISFSYVRFADLLVTHLPLTFQVNVEREAQKR